MITNQDFINYCGIDLKKRIKGDITNIEEQIEVFFERMQSHLVDYLPGLKVSDLTDAEETTLNKAIMEQAFYQLSNGDGSLIGDVETISNKAVMILKNGCLWSFRL